MWSINVRVQQTFIFTLQWQPGLPNQVTEHQRQPKNQSGQPEWKKQLPIRNYVKLHCCGQLSAWCYQPSNCFPVTKIWKVFSNSSSYSAMTTGWKWCLTPESDHWFSRKIVHDWVIKWLCMCEWAYKRVLALWRRVGRNVLVAGLLLTKIDLQRPGVL